MPYSLITGPGAVPLAILHRCLDPRGAAPLEPSIRHFMEGRFQAGLGDVRIHTGPAAAALCGALQARALTWGRDIAFGAGQYDSATLAGRRLLAHELAHVLQQRLAARPVPSVTVPVGGPDDGCETEADQLAEQALAGGLRAAVMPDAAGAIRRVTFDKVQITVDLKGSAPFVFLQPQGIGTYQGSAIFHLNKNKFRNDRPLQAAMDDDAGLRERSVINIKGEAVVRMGRGEDIGDWDFQFIQAAKLRSSEGSRAGCESSGGSIEWDEADADVFDGAGAWVLDSYPVDGVFPYIVNRPVYKQTTQRDGSILVSNDMDDLPTATAKYVAVNPLTEQRNFLSFFTHAGEMYTAFVAVNDNATPKDVRILAYVHWSFSWRAAFKWPAGPTGLPTYTLFAKETSFNAEKGYGSPNDSSVVDLITHAHTADRAKTMNKMAEETTQRLKARYEAIKAAGRSVNPNDVMYPALEIRTTWPPIRDPGPDFCVIRG